MSYSISTGHSQIVGKILYGLLFILILPALLIIWSRTVTFNVDLSPFHLRPVGIVLVLCGAVIMFSGMLALIVFGKGLPMNAYPPIHYVSNGIYRLTAHPIYTGFSILCVGFALAFDSASGLLLISPVVILGCLALVQGYEKQDLEKRFGSSRAKPLIHLSENEAAPPTFADRLSVYVLVVVPWILLYETVRWIGIPADAVVAYFPFEVKLRVYEWTEIIYASTYAVALVAPLVAKSKKDLRDASISGWVATALVILLFLTLPFIAPPRPFVAQVWPGRLLLWEREHDTAAAAFPSFHVVWAFLVARVYARRWASLRFIWWGWAVAVSLSCITVGMHALVDVLGGLVVVWFVTHLEPIWEHVRKLCERIANSWREWQFGSVRIINHGGYAAATALVGLSIVGLLLGPAYVFPMMLMGLSIVITSALWAQLIEGSPALLRPYGWYGGVLGAIIGAFIAKLSGASPWLLLGSFCVAAPWFQSIGRLRCLIQGCCHGREAPAAVGILYRHPRSRVCKLASLAGVPVHPTPLYSIIGNVIIGIVMARLWSLHTPLSLIIGPFLILTGLSRFVEEAYRGEPQTPIRAGLKIYQWIAIVCVLAGVVITMVPQTPWAPRPQPNWQSIAAAVCFAIFAFVALGVDFPNSTKRFARLA